MVTAENWPVKPNLSVDVASEVAVYTVSWCVCVAVLAPVKSKSSHKIDDIEDKINSCLSDVHGDAGDVVDVIRKAITNDDNTGYVD